MVETTNSTPCVRARKRNIVAGIPELISVRKASMRMPIVVNIGYTPCERGLKTVAVASSFDMFITAQTRFSILPFSITRQDFRLILKIIRNDGAIFEQGTDEIQSAFRFAMFNHNKNTTIRKFELQAFVDVINTADAYKLSRLICTQFSRGVYSILGVVSPDSFDTLHSYSNTFQMPFMTPWFPEKVLTPSSGLLDFAISMRPDYHRAIIDTVRYYGWKKIIYLYDSHDGESS
ncbi:hypothetical protein HZH66_012358 [Vespula vulgaris]|uniref:Receptor ligand binding region domain-containing protein n=1 Tax=Vespula vulgaris TaxID=7454 RepID=A0A834MV50_VESVU|nr:hypothetical protein HZH66_012358 [Vespula vulgaris]